LPASGSSPPIFLYGTLLRGEPAHHLLEDRVTFVEDATVAGTLISLGQYPGLLAGRGRVRGEVWRLRAPEVLRTLDEYEGYNFERCTTTATLARGRRVRVLVYRYRGPRTRAQLAVRAVERERRSTSHVVEKVTVIPEGDWRGHRWR
jgi:gamma-glutamylcyclotransferase (GGCT)/AIG2-like uncharacterized protein YtfP